MPSKNMSSGIYEQPMPRSACIYMQSDKGFQNHLILQNVYMESKGLDVQDDLNQRILCMFEGTFLLDTFHAYWTGDQS